MRLGVPYKVVGGTRFYDRREVKDAMAYLRAVVNPADEVSVKRVLNVPKRGVGDASIAKLDALAAARGHLVHRCAAPRRRGRRHRAGGARASTRSSTLLDELGAMLAAATTTARRPAPATCCRRRSTTPATWPSWRRRTRSRRTAGSRTSASSSGRPASSRVIDEFLEQVALVADTDELPDGEVEDQVVLMTLHSAKGLEFPVVFLIGVEEGVFPHIRALTEPDRDGGGAAPGLRRHHPGPRAPVHAARLEPQLFGSTQYNPPSRFFDEIPDELVESTRATSAAVAPTAARACGRASDWGDAAAVPSRAAAARHRRRRAADRGPPRAGRRGGPGGGAAQGARCRAMPRTRAADRRRRRAPGVRRGRDHRPRGQGEKAEATINFAGVGTKHLALAWAPLKKR